MSKKGQVQYEIISDFLHGALSRKEASELLGVRERTITRLARRIEQKGKSSYLHVFQLKKELLS